MILYFPLTLDFLIIMCFVVKPLFIQIVCLFGFLYLVCLLPKVIEVFSF